MGNGRSSQGLTSDLQAGILLPNSLGRRASEGGNRWSRKPMEFLTNLS